MTRTVLFLVSFVALLTSCWSDCPEEIPGYCNRNNSQYSHDTKVYDSSSLNCRFDNNLCCYRQGCCDDGMDFWKPNTGFAQAKQIKTICGAQSFSILESRWVNVSAPMCVKIVFSEINSPYQIQVFQQKYDKQVRKKVSDLKIGHQKQTSCFPLNTSTSKIFFRLYGGGGSNVLAPKLFSVAVQGGNCEGNCATEPEYGDHTRTSHTTVSCSFAEHTTLTAKHTLSSSAGSTTESSTSSASSSLSSDGPKESSGMATDRSNAEGGNDPNVAVIAGASVAVVIVVAIIVFVLIVLRRKFRTKTTGGKKRNFVETPTGDGGYVNIDAAGSPIQTLVFGANIKTDDPYELAEDGAPGQTRNSITNTNNVIQGDEASYANQHHYTNGTLDGDYSRVDDVQRPTAGIAGKNDVRHNPNSKDVHSVVINEPGKVSPLPSLAKIVDEKPALPNPNDVYSVVNKPGKKASSPAGYSLAKIVDEKPTLPNPNDVYSVVNKKGRKPTIAPKPGTSDAEHNTVSHTGRRTTNQGAGDASADTYNKIGAVPSLGPNGRSQESTEVGEGSPADEYNTLDFEVSRQNASRKEKTGAYDHVRNNPDDSGYSKTRIGERNVVIDSEYHHLQA